MSMGMYEPTLDLPCPIGANYVPARAGNAYRFWKDYEPETTERDLGYARELRLTSVRVQLSQQAWADDGEAFASAFEHFLSTAESSGLGVIPVLFEGTGLEPTRARLSETDPVLAVNLCEPGTEVVRSPSGWHRPRALVDWFMKLYANDRRLLAIEIMNAPGGAVAGSEAGIVFAREMLRYAGRRHGSAPLTMGCQHLRRNAYFLDCGLDLLQWHMNFPRSPDHMRKLITTSMRWQRILGKPVWLTEWQRLRTSGAGEEEEPTSREEVTPDYASLAPLVQKYPIGQFFVSLMVRPAYAHTQRCKGVISGVFHEDGAVWSLKDARAIAGDSSFEAAERPELPSWALDAAERLSKAGY